MWINHVQNSKFCNFQNSKHPFIKEIDYGAKRKNICIEGLFYKCLSYIFVFLLYQFLKCVMLFEVKEPSKSIM